MKQFITDERTGLQYELIGDYYFIAGEDNPEEIPIGIWGKRHLRYLRKHRKGFYTTLLTSGRLNSYLAEMDREAEEMFSWLVKQMAEQENVTEALKERDQMIWVQKMNNIHNRAREIVNNDLIYN